MFSLFIFSVFHSKLGNKNQVFHKCKPEKVISPNPEEGKIEKQNSIEKLNSSLSSGKCHIILDYFLPQLNLIILSYEDVFTIM